MHANAPKNLLRISDELLAHRCGILDGILKESATIFAARRCTVAVHKCVKVMLLVATSPSSGVTGVAATSSTASPGPRWNRVGQTPLPCAESFVRNPRTDVCPANLENHVAV